MAFLDGVKAFFSSRGKANPLNTVWVMDKMNLSDAADEKQLKPLPLIGKLVPRAQMAILLMVMIVASVAFLVVAFMSFQMTTRYSEMRAISTEMQMLSQRMARGMSEAMQGDTRSFDVLEEAYVRFGNNLWSLEARTGFMMEVPDALQDVGKIWERTFIPQSGKPSVNSVLDQKSNLITLADRVNQTASSDAELSILARDFAQLSTSRLPAKEQTNAFLLPLYVSQLTRYTASLISGGTFNPEWVPQLVASADRFNKLVAAFTSGNSSMGISAVSDPDLSRLLARISEHGKTVNRLRDLVMKVSGDLGDARIAGLAILRDCDSLLTETTRLADFYESKAQTRFSIAVEVVLAALALASLYLLVRVFNQESVRRRMQSEAQNKANQEAILRLLNDMADLADGDLTVRAMVTEDLTGAIADSINYTIEELRSLITEINRATDQVTRVTGQAQQISDELLSAAEKQS